MLREEKQAEEKRRGNPKGPKGPKGGGRGAADEGKGTEA